MNADASALMLLTALALGTFTAGLRGGWRMCLIGRRPGAGRPAYRLDWRGDPTLIVAGRSRDRISDDAFPH